MTETNGLFLDDFPGHRCTCQDSWRLVSFVCPGETRCHRAFMYGDLLDALDIFQLPHGTPMTCTMCFDRLPSPEQQDRWIDFLNDLAWGEAPRETPTQLLQRALATMAMSGQTLQLSDLWTELPPLTRPSTPPSEAPNPSSCAPRTSPN